MAKQSELNERRERDFLNAVLENAGALVVVLDSEGRVYRFNKACQKLSGYTEEEILGKYPWETFLPPEVADTVREQAFEALAHNPEKLAGEYTNEWLSKDGNRKLLEWSNTLLLDGDGRMEYMVSVGTDITEQHAIKEKLSLQKDVLERTEELAGIGSWELNLKTNEIIWSTQMYRMHGLDPETTNPDYNFVLNTIHPDDQKLLQDAITDALKSGKFFLFDHRLLRPDGEVRHVRAEGSVVYDDNSEPEYMHGFVQDITERKKADEINVKLNERLNLATRSASIGIWDWDIKNDVLIWDDRVYELFGGTKKELGGAGKAWVSGLHPDDRQETLRLISEAVEKGTLYDDEFRVHWPDGTVRHIKSSGQVIRDEQGQPVRMIGVNYDITERKKSEQKLIQSETRLAEAQRLARIGSWELDIVSNQLYWSDETYRIFELDKDSFIPSYEAFLDRIHPDDRDMVDKRYTNSLTTKEPYEIGHRLKMPDGRIKYVQERCETSFDEEGNPLRSIGAIQDVTESKRIVEEKDQLSEKLSLATRTSNIGIWDWDIINNRLEWDENLYDLYGISRDEFGEAYEAWEAGVHPEDLPYAKKAVEQALKGEKSYDTEFRIVLPGRDIRYTRALANVIRDDDGVPVRMLGINYDITDRKRIEMELDQHRYSLEQLVRKRTRELEASLREKDILLQEVHHRVKNNLAMVSAFMQLKKRQVGDEEAVNAIESCEERIQAMALAHKKLYQSSDLSYIDMQGLLEELSAAIYLADKHKNVRVNINANNTRLDMDYAIPCALIVNELLSNALKYAFVDDDKGEINILIRKSGGNEYCLDFKDNGIGFDDGFDINAADTLGLQLVNIFIKQLGGTLELCEESGAHYIIHF